MSHLYLSLLKLPAPASGKLSRKKLGIYTNVHETFWLPLFHPAKGKSFWPLNTYNTWIRNFPPKDFHTHEIQFFNEGNCNQRIDFKQFLFKIFNKINLCFIFYKIILSFHCVGCTLQKIFFYCKNFILQVRWFYIIRRQILGIIKRFFINFWNS